MLLVFKCCLNCWLWESAGPQAALTILMNFIYILELKILCSCGWRTGGKEQRNRMRDLNSYPKVKVRWKTHDDQSEEQRNRVPRDAHEWDSGGGVQENIKMLWIPNKVLLLLSAFFCFACLLCDCRNLLWCAATNGHPDVMKSLWGTDRGWWAVTAEPNEAIGQTRRVCSQPAISTPEEVNCWEHGRANFCRRKLYPEYTNACTQKARH